MRADFIHQRQLELQLFINQVLMNPILASSLPTKKFIDPDSYSTPFQGTKSKPFLLQNFNQS